MPIQPIKNIKAYSEQDGLDKVAAVEGEFEVLGGAVQSLTVFQPYTISHSGLVQDEPVTLTFDVGNQPMTIKNLKFDTNIPRANCLFFVL